MTPSLFEFRLSILKQEIDQLQNNIRNYNNLLMIVKGWSITVFSAIFAYSISKSKPMIPLFSTTIVLMFWVFETYLRKIQQFFIARYNKVEWFLRSPKLLNEAWDKQRFPKLNFPDLTARRSVKEIKSKTSFFKIAIRKNVSILYLFQLLLLLFCWILLKKGVF